MKVHELYADESKWTQGTAARDSKGEGVWYDDPEAISFCLFGALNKCYPYVNERIKILEKIWPKIDSDIPIWNDQLFRTFDEVKQLAISLDI